MFNTQTKIREFKFYSNSYSKALFDLMKPRVMSLAVFTCVVGLIIAPVQIDLLSATLSIIAVALGSGAAGALNMWYESDLDSLMSRTCLRPIPTGRLTRKQALIFGTLMSFISVISLYFFSNLVAASYWLRLFYLRIYLYNLVKRKTPQNIVIGGAAAIISNRLV